MFWHVFDICVDKSVDTCVDMCVGTCMYRHVCRAKTMVAQLVGIAVTKGMLDLDTPIKRYGVDTSILKQYNESLTLRHILSQSTGRGRMPPGSHMTYDSDAFIQLISPTLGKVVPGGNVIAWAEAAYAKPMGMPGIFRGDAYVGGGNISAGGGQRMTYRHVYEHAYRCVHTCVHRHAIELCINTCAPSV